MFGSMEYYGCIMTAIGNIPLTIYQMTQKIQNSEWDSEKGRALQDQTEVQEDLLLGLYDAKQIH